LYNNSASPSQRRNSEAVPQQRTDNIMSTPPTGRLTASSMGSQIAFGLAGHLLIYTLDPFKESLLTNSWNAIADIPFDPLDVNQDSVHLFQKYGNDPVLRTAIIAYRAVIGPLLEESYFRGTLQGSLRGRLSQLGISSAVTTSVTVLGTACLFGACHLSPFQNSQTNFLVFASTATNGLVYSLLSEATDGKLLAPATAHICHNIVSVLRTL
jgi:membrane protease YdiL (CAAX protease family)